MNRIIDKEYVKDNYVQLMIGFGTSDNVLVASTNEIIFLINDGNIVINKYLDHEARYEFPKSDNSSHVNDKDKRLYNMIFKTNTSYIIYYSDNIDNHYSSNIFSKNDDGSVLWNEYKFEFEEKSSDMNLYKEKDLEEFILSYHDAIHLIDFKGNVVYSSTTEDGKVIDLKSQKIHYPLVGIFGNNNSLEAFIIGKRLGLYLVKNITLPNVFEQSIASCLENPNDTEQVNPPSI